MCLRRTVTCQKPSAVLYSSFFFHTTFCLQRNCGAYRYNLFRYYGLQIWAFRFIHEPWSFVGGVCWWVACHHHPVRFKFNSIMHSIKVCRQWHFKIPNSIVRQNYNQHAIWRHSHDLKKKKSNKKKSMQHFMKLRTVHRCRRVFFFIALLYTKIKVIFNCQLNLHVTIIV